MATAPPTRIPRDLRILLAANFVSEVGSGMTLPFLLIYLHQVRHISLGLVGLMIGGSAVVAVPIGPAAGALVDRFGPRFICAIALTLNGLGALALTLVHSPISAIPVLFLYGVGQGAMWPAWTALFAVMTRDPALRPRVFARSFQLLNLGLGTGSVVAGAFVRVAHPGTFDVIYLVDGLTFSSVIIALFLLPARAFARAETGEDDQPAHPRGGFREVLSDRRFLRYMACMCALALAGYAAVNAGYVGYATTVVKVHPSVIAWAFGVNTGLIVALQPISLRLVNRMRRTTALAVCAAFFGASWVVLILGGMFPRSATGDVLVVAMFGVFAIGETMLSPVATTIVTTLARPSLQGRYNATASSMYTVAQVIGPAIAGVMLQAHLGNEYVGLLVALCAVAIAATQWLRRALPPEIDNADRSAPPLELTEPVEAPTPASSGT